MFTEPIIVHYLLRSSSGVGAHPGIRGVRRGHNEHKLLLYADDILSDPLTSLHTMQSFSKFSGYSINWSKSQATPLSKSCFAFMLEKFNFRWVHKGMKYLGTKSSEDISEIITLNT